MLGYCDDGDTNVKPGDPSEWSCPTGLMGSEK